MLNFFDTIIAYVELFIEYVINFFVTLGTLLTVLVEAVVMPQQLIMVMPSFLAASVAAVLGISVAKLLLWGNNK